MAFETKSVITLRVNLDKISNDTRSKSVYLWLDLAIIMFALLSLFLTWKYIFEVMHLYNEIKQKCQWENMAK